MFLRFVCFLGDLRLVGGTVPSEGGVESFYNDTWGTICDGKWSGKNGEVVCRQLGYEDEVNIQMKFKKGSSNCVDIVQNLMNG